MTREMLRDLAALFWTEAAHADDEGDRVHLAATACDIEGAIQEMARVESQRMRAAARAEKEDRRGRAA